MLPLSWISTGRIVGIPTDMTYSQFLEVSLQQAIDNIATHVMQFYLIAPDGSILMPIHSFPFHGCTESCLLSWISTIQSELTAIEISWISTDGDLPDLEECLKPKNLVLFLRPRTRGQMWKKRNPR